jgi:serine/threonine-protein kinase
MASVWAAEDAVLGRQVAVKVLASHVAAEPAARTRFEREARTAARVSNHPNVVTIYDVGEQDGTPFIVMELLTGGSVADRLRSRRPVPSRQALAWLTEAAAALDYAHAEGIVHRDVKPANLLLDERDRIAVGDFGIARLADDTSLTQAGQVLGTAAYLSPEQAVGRPATDASDRYALAVVAFELLTGRRPFEGEHVAAQARQHVEAEPPSTGLGAAVDEVVDRAMAKEPDARYITAAAFVEDLASALRRSETPRTEPTRAVAAAAPAPTPRPRRLAPEPTPTPPPPRGPAPVARRDRDGSGGRRGWMLVAALAAVVLVGAAIALAAGGGDDEPDRAGDEPATTTEQRPQARTETQPETTPAAPAPAETQPAPADNEAEPGPGPSDTGESPGALNDEGYARLQSGDAAGAIPLLEQSVEGFDQQGGGADPTTFGYALYNLGTAYAQTGRYDEAIAMFERRLQVNPDDRPGVVRKAIRDAKSARGQGQGQDDD